ncbi:MAG: sodium/proline symporter [Gammaproteobacteria bacterium]
MIGASFALYLAVIAVIAVLAWRRTRDIADYLLGGRRIGPWVAALSAGASDMSGWLLLGLPGLAVTLPGAATWTAAGLLVGTWCNWRFVARPLREASAALDALTVPAYFAARFPARGRVLRALTALTIVVFFLLYTSAGLVAGGKLFNTVFGLPYAPAVILGAAVIVAYTLYGGFLAVAWTDALQALMMSAALLAVALLLWSGSGAPALPAAVQAPDLPAVLSALAWGLGYFGQPHILARFMALADAGRVSTARRIGVGWSALGLVTAVAVGIGGAGLVGVADDPERVFILAVEATLAPWLAGACLAAILAAIMSTADSQLLVTAAALAEDLLPLARAPSDAAARLRSGRIAVAVVAALATLVALDPQAGVFELVARAWAGFGATLGPALLVALYRNDASGAGALGGMLSGAVVVLAWPWLPGDGYGIYELLPGFSVAGLVNLAINRHLSRARAAHPRV